MSKQGKGTLAAAIALALAIAGQMPRAVAAGPLASLDGPGPASAAELASLLAVHVEGSVVRLEADAEVEYESFRLENPDRLVIDLPGVISRLDATRFTMDREGVERVRASQHRVEPLPVTRVVFDLDSPVPYRIDRDGSSLEVVFGDEPATLAAAEVPPDSAPVEIAAPDPGASDEPLAQVEPATVAVVDAPAAAAAMPAGFDPAPIAPAPTPAEVPTPAAEPSAPRSVDPAAIERLLSTPAFAAPQADSESPSTTGQLFETKRISGERTAYQGKRISLNLVDADLKQVFRLFHEISGLNFVLDPEVQGRVTIVLDSVPWDQALDIILKNNGLDKVLENNVLRIATTRKLAEEAASRKRLKEAEELEVEPVTLTRTLSYAKAKQVVEVVRQGGILSDRGKVIVDERTNTLILSDIPKRIEPLDALITSLDSETPQVMIEARIVETSKTYSRDLGVRWGLNAFADAAHGTATGLSFPHNATGRYALNLPGAQQASELAFSFGNIVDSFTLDLALYALEEEGRGRIISAPKIATQNNERAEIEQGVRIPIANTTATEIQVEFVSASLLLQVTPQITAEGTIILDVTVENNSPDFVQTANGIPSIRTQRAQTKVLINDGGTTVIGGIFVVNEGNSERGVPWFRKIPVFGWLFKEQNISQENRELLIFITPKIVKLG